MKELKKILTISKIFNVISKILYVMTKISFWLFSFVLLMFVFSDKMVDNNGISLKKYIIDNANLEEHVIYYVLIVMIVISIFEAICFKSINNYLEKELEEGTIFSIDGSKYLFKTGIKIIVLNLSCIIINELIKQLIELIYDKDIEILINNSTFIYLGFIFILFSSVFKCGYELINENKNL